MTKSFLLIAAVVATIGQTGADRWLGSWIRGNASLEIRREKTDPSRIAFTLTVTTPRGCTGEAAGETAASDLAKTAITLKAGLPTKPRADARWYLKLTSDGDLTVDEGTCGGLHGAACDFAGTYTR